MKRKTNQSGLHQKNRRIVRREEPEVGEHCFFSEIICYIHPANFGAQRLKIFQNQMRKYGGEVLETLPCSSETISHIIFEETVNVEKLNLLLDTSKYKNSVFIKCSWLVACFKAKEFIDSKIYEIIPCVDRPEKCQQDEASGSTVCSETKRFEEIYHLTVDNNDSSSFATLYKKESPFNREPPPKLSKDFGPSNIDVCPSVVDNLVREENCDHVESANKELGWKSEGNQSSQISSEIKAEQIQAYSDDALSQNVVGTDNVQDLIARKQPYPRKFQEKFVCARPSNSKVDDLNSHITLELEKLAAAYKSTKDTWRALGYQKAISAIRNFPRKITSREEARSIPGVGERLADKVAEIIESGKLRKVSEVCEGEEAETLKLFMGVWGAGPTTAQSWYAQGFRTLQDLHTKAALTRHQQIGLKHYDDINSRIPRAEVSEIEEFVRSAALSIKKGLVVMVCGSYRRGKATCGDVDVLITHPDGQSHENIFKLLLRHLKEVEFLTDDLVTQEDNENQQKYLGVCKLPGKDRKHRRLDVIVVPYAEFAPAVMYFTGSAHFNRSMRLLATKMGMSLSEHGLRAGIVRQGREKLSDGHLLDTPTEESIFKQLGLEYRSPQERDH